MAAQDESKLAQDLTLILLRANGTPRAFRIRVPSLVRSLLSLSGSFLALGACTVAFIALLIWHNRSFSLPRVQLSAPVSAPSTTTAPATPAPSTPAADSSSQALDAIPAPDSVLREEIAKLARELEGRKQLPPGESASQAATGNTPVQLFSSQSTALAANDVFVEAKNLRASRNAGIATLDFDLQNTHPQQQQQRGFIVVLAKTAQALYTYPETVLSPKDNFLVNYARGETFAISRFRQASAKFTHIPTDSGPIHYQILLFNTRGKIMISTHIEGK